MKHTERNEEVKEGNKLIAEFMGAKCELVDHTEGNEDYCKSKGIDKWLIPTWSKPEGGKWLYHSSWDWLMPVVERIDQLTVPENLHLGINNLTVFAEIEDVYKAVIEFIKWYNQQST